MSTNLLPPRLNTPQIEVLPNGLTIIAEQMPVEAVSFHLWLQVGSRWEGDEINGVAHFLEHMVFKGTPRLAMGEFEQVIESRGASTNAATSQDYTQFYTTCAPQDFAELAPLQLEVVLNPAIADDPFERERLVVLEEIRRSHDDPQRRIFQAVFKLAFPKTPLCPSCPLRSPDCGAVTGPTNAGFPCPLVSTPSHDGHGGGQSSDRRVNGNSGPEFFRLLSRQIPFPGLNHARLRSPWGF